MQRPWNKSSETIYSLSTLNQECSPNMNICTYVKPISMKPKKYMIALYKGTKTYENFATSDYAILQILAKDCKKYISAFGKKSWNTVDKLKKRQDEIFYYEWIPVLHSSAAYLYVKKQDFIKIPWSDHDLWIVDVISWKYLDTWKEFLSTDDIY